MELKEVIENRRSIRVFNDEKINKSDITEIVRLANLAPSINNSHPWQYIAISKKDILEKMADLVIKQLHQIGVKSENKNTEKAIQKIEWYSTFFKDAPMVVAVCLKPYSSVLEFVAESEHSEINKQRHYPDIQSLGASIQNFLLAATDMGYATCWLSAPSIASDSIQKILPVNNGHEIYAFIAIGKSDVQPKEKDNVDIDEVLVFVE